MVSIIIPVYKAEKCLDFCVQSLIEQTYTDIEIILVEDGSPDKSGEICDAWSQKDSRIKVVHKRNGGVSAARNTGIDVASGQYIVFVDSDDYAEPDYVERLIEERRSHTDCGHIWCNIQTVEGYAHESAQPNISPDADLIMDRSHIMTLHDMWLDAGPVNKLYHVNVINDHNLRFDEELSLGEDLLFNYAYLSAVSNTKIIVIGKPLYNYVRGNAESLDSKYRDNLFEIYAQLNSKIEKFLLQWNIDEKQMDMFYNSRFYLYDRALRNAMKAPQKGFFCRLRIANEIMKTDVFQQAYQERVCYINPIYELGYRLKNFGLILLVDCVRNIQTGGCRKP